MKQEYKKFPYFGYGEILTSGSLNGAFAYNEEQLRLTRCYTIGYGILEGLSYTFSNGNLTLQPGVAITPDGHLVKIDAPITYKSVKPNDTMDYDYDLCTSEKKAKTTTFPDNMTDYVVVLSASVGPSPTSHVICTEVSCDVSNTVKELLIDVHLKKKEHTDTCTCQIAPFIKTVRLKRMEGAVRNLNLLEKIHQKLFTNNLACVHDGLITLCKIINPCFKSNNKALVPLKCWNLLFTNAKNTKHLAKGLFAFTHSYGNNWHDTMKSYPIYYFQHLEILADAINECIAYYNKFAIDYPLLPTTHILNDNEIFLGLGCSADLNINQRYRSIFCRTSDGELISHAHMLECLLKRVVLLCDNFMENNNFKGSLHLRWYDPTKPLGERPIPYFYRENTQLYEYWMSADKKPYPYSNAPDMMEPTNKSNERLFLDGLYRCSDNYVKEQLTKYIEEHHLDISVEVVKLVKKTLRGNNGNLGMHPRKNYKRILDNTVTNANYRQKIAEKAKTNPVVLCFNKLPGSWKSYVSAAVDNKELDFSTVKNIVNAFSEVNIENYVDYLNIIPVDGKKITWKISDSSSHKDNTVAAFLALKSYFLLSYGLEYDAAEYMQGHPNGSKIILFSYNGKVFFDANIKK